MKNSSLFTLLLLASFCLLYSCSKDEDCKQSTFYKDTDGDGFGDAASSKDACTQPSGYVADKTDTDDTNAAIFPGCTQVAFYRDADGDGFGDPANSQNACAAPDGFVNDNTDPNDADATITPTSCTEVTFYQDADGDGFGNAAVTQEACLAPEGYVADNTDTDDTDADIFPGCVETTYYEDTDGDGFGNPDVTQSSCSALEGYVTDNTDCNDADANIHPGANDDPDDGIDSDCDGTQETRIWSGADITFTKAANTDWTLPENQDQITGKVIFTRQNSGPMYNYQWWQDTFGEDAVHNNSDSSDLTADFWNSEFSSIKDFTAIMASGGTKGVRWALLDDTGANIPGPAWDDFPLYGTLGASTHFYSFHNLVAIITSLENGNAVNQVLNDFEIDSGQDAFFDNITGKRLGVWLVEEDIYFTLTFTEWGNGIQNPGGPISYTRSTPN